MPGEMGMGGRGLKGGMRDMVLLWVVGEIFMVVDGSNWCWTKPCWARPSSTELYVAYDDPQGLKAQRWPEQQ